MLQRARPSRTRAPRLDDTFLMYGVLGNRPSSSADGRGLTGDQVHETRGEAQTLGRLIVTEAMVRRSGNGTMEPADCRAEPPRARSARCDPEQGASAGWRRRAAPSPRHPKGLRGQGPVDDRRIAAAVTRPRTAPLPGGGPGGKRRPPGRAARDRRPRSRSAPARRSGGRASGTRGRGR